MSIGIGDRLPHATFKILTDSGLTDLTTEEVFAGKKVAVFAVPGAFTPTCHAKHLPGFLEHVADFRDKGIDTVACIAVNDANVLDAWAKSTGADGKILFLADGNAEFTKAIGLDFDNSAAGRGVRSRRYSMLVEDGVVKALNVEDAPGKVEVSGAEALLKQID